MYEVLRQLCCDSWGIPPWEFDAAAESGRIEFAAVAEAVRSRLASQSPEALLAWIAPDHAAARKRRAEAATRERQLRTALSLAKKTRNKDAEAAILAELEKLTNVR